MPYSDNPEYPQHQLDMMDELLNNRFIGDITVDWLWASNPLNYKNKVDGIVHILVANSKDTISLQVKGTEHDWSQNITVGKAVLDRYVKYNYPIDSFMCVFFNRNIAFLFDWNDFVGYAGEVKHRWLADNGRYYLIPVLELLDTLGEDILGSDKAIKEFFN